VSPPGPAERQGPRAPAGAGSPPGAPLSGRTRVFGIVGDPVSHSISPIIQNAAFRALGLDAVYVAFPIAPARLAQALPGLASAGVQGLNVTLPHKQAVIPLCAALTEEARAIGAVNTLKAGPDGWHATNTDGSGFMLSLEHDLHWAPRGKHALMLGAGGAARAVGWQLLKHGAARLTIANRHRERAEALAADLRKSPGGEVAVVAFDGVAGLAPDLLVNTTSVGMHDGRSPVELAALRVREAVMDIVYAPPVTPLLEQAAALGLPRTNGMGMLLYQGVAAFRFFTGEEPPVEVMRAALAEELARRGN
jgi:shikimate dehydrogenase